MLFNNAALLGWNDLIHMYYWSSPLVEIYFEQYIAKLSTKSFRYKHIDIKRTLEIFKRKYFIHSNSSYSKIGERYNQCHIIDKL